MWQALSRPRLLPDPVDNVLAAVAACGLVPFADWIVSQAAFIERHRRPHLPPEWTPESAAVFLASGVEAARAELRRLGLTPLRLRNAAFTERYPYSPRGVQLSICSELDKQVTGPGLLIVTERTGGGKTEVAQEALQVFRRRLGRDLGLMFCLPTMATTNAMFGRTVGDLAPLLGRGATVELLHSMAAFSDEADRVLRDLYGDPADTSLLDTGIEACALGPVASEEHAEPFEARFGLSDRDTHKLLRLHAPLAVATIDQLLAAALPGWHQPFRLSGLFGKVVVIDECHAYDVYMRVLLRTVLTWLGAFGVPVVLLSATLPAGMAREYLEAYRRGSIVGHTEVDNSRRSEDADPLTPPYPLVLLRLRDRGDDGAGLIPRKIDPAHRDHPRLHPPGRPTPRPGRAREMAGPTLPGHLDPHLRFGRHGAGERVRAGDRQYGDDRPGPGRPVARRGDRRLCDPPAARPHARHRPRAAHRGPGGAVWKARREGSA